jgi:VanZ family protein
MTLRNVLWALGFALVVAAIYVCLLPFDDVPQPFHLTDKANHVIGHAALAVYFTGLVERRSWWKIFAGLLLMGVGIELAQNFMHMGRVADVRDVLANCLGAALGLLLGWIGLARWTQWAAILLGRRPAP